MRFFMPITPEILLFSRKDCTKSHVKDLSVCQLRRGRGYGRIKLSKGSSSPAQAEGAHRQDGRKARAAQRSLIKILTRLLPGVGVSFFRTRVRKSCFPSTGGLPKPPFPRSPPPDQRFFPAGGVPGCLCRQTFCGAGQACPVSVFPYYLS